MSCARLYLQGKPMMARAQKQKVQERVPWSQGEDRRLVEYMQRHGETGRWKDVPTGAGLDRSPKSCRLRWNSKLKPGINQKPFSEKEEATIIKLQKQLGNKWATIAKHLPGRTDTGIKNFWHNNLKKKLSKEETPSLVTQTPRHQLLDTADLLTCPLNDPRDEVRKLHSDASFAWNPRHGHRSHLNYQATEDPTVYYPDQFGPLITSFLNTIPFPQLNQNYAVHVGSLFGNIPPATQTPIQPLLAVADGLTSAAAYLRSYAPGLHSDAQLPNLPSLHNPVVQQGFGDITPDPEAQLHGVGSISTDPAGALPAQGPGFNYQAMDPTVYNHPDQFGPLITSIPNTGVLIPDPKVNNNYAADLGSLFGNVPNAGSTHARMVSESSERSMTNQVENEMTPPTEEIFPLEALLEEFPSAENGETSDSFCGYVALV